MDKYDHWIGRLSLKDNGKFYLREKRVIETPGRNIGAAISMLQAAILQLKERLSLI